MRRGERAERSESLWSVRDQRISLSSRALEKEEEGDAPDDVALGARAWGDPERENVLVPADRQDDAVDLLADAIVVAAADALAHERIDDLLPHTVGDALAQAHDPAPAAHVGRVLPRGRDRRAEDVVVADEVRGCRG